jgi:uncharacterized protein YbcV (DUF1398 family)
MEEKILREILATTKENNDILRSLNMQRKWVNFFWFFKWLIVAAIAYSAYLAATPYIEQAQQTINGLQNLNTQVQQMQNMDQKSFTNFLRGEIEKRLKP